MVLNLARGRVQLNGLLARTLARARVRTRALAADRQTLAVAHATVGAEVHQALDVHRVLAAQIAFDGGLSQRRTDRVHFRLGEVLHLGGRLDARRLADRDRTRTTHAEDVRETDDDVLVHRDVDAGNTCHVRLPQPWRCLWRVSEQMT